MLALSKKDLRNLTMAIALAALTAFSMGCEPKYPSCDNDGHCRPKGEYCVNGLCQQCRTNDQCGACRTCNAGACQAIVGCCTHAGDCSVGQSCRNGSCGPECLDDTECGTAAKCSSGRCVPDVECTGPGDCPGGETCSDGRCVPQAEQRGGVECSLENVTFGFDSAEISSEGGRVLSANARCLESKGNPKIIIGGHCDDRGTEEYNLHLGERRARSAKRYLEKLGASGFKVVSYGENRPLHSPARGEAEHSENRRAGFDLR